MARSDRARIPPCEWCRRNTPRLGETICAACQDADNREKDFNEILSLIRDDTAAQTYRFDAIADALELIWRKI